MSDNHDIKTPGPLIFGAAALIFSVTAFVGISQATGFGHPELSTEAHVEKIALRFQDEPDGGVGAYQVKDDAPLFTYGPGEGGFVRTALRSLTLDRRKAGVGPLPPFELMRSATGNIVLSDPSTGKRITLNAFGGTNQESFAKLFDADAERLAK